MFTAAATTIVSGGIEDILSGGRPKRRRLVSSGGTEFDFGTASGGTLSGGVQYVYASALAGTVASGGVEDILVRRGGERRHRVERRHAIRLRHERRHFVERRRAICLMAAPRPGRVASGGLEDILSGGSASGGTVSSGGTEFDFGTASDVALSGGLQYVMSAAAATIASGGIEDIIAGGTASGVTVSGGHQLWQRRGDDTPRAAAVMKSLIRADDLRREHDRPRA